MTDNRRKALQAIISGLDYYRGLLRDYAEDEQNKVVKRDLEEARDCTGDSIFLIRCALKDEEV